MTNENEKISLVHKSDDSDLDKYPKHKLFKVFDYTFKPHPYMITPYHSENNPHYMYIGKEQIEQMESDIHHSLCGWGRTASGKYEKKGQTACDLLYAEHERVLLVSIEPNTYSEIFDKTYLKESKNELNEYLMSIKDLIEKDGFIGVGFVKEETKSE